jgi:hypothetical protein
MLSVDVAYALYLVLTAGLTLWMGLKKNWLACGVLAVVLLVVVLLVGLPWLPWRGILPLSAPVPREAPRVV